MHRVWREAPEGDPVTWLFLLLLRLLLIEADPDADDPDEDEDDPEPDDEDEELTEEQLADIEATRDPEARIKSLMLANARLGKKVEKLETGTSNGSHALRDARLEAEFMREAIRSGHLGLDLDAAWDLGHAKKIFDLVKVKADGSVKGMDRALETILSRYPYLADDPDPDEPEPRPKVRPPKTGTGRKAKDTSGALDQSVIRERFPSLKKRRRI